ncbi:MAG TPA: SH3 domain-containing protein [Spirochaetota bacterium]|nr:SH3 domain-containing protein [Spirochaetota bacterium]
MNKMTVLFLLVLIGGGCAVYGESSRIGYVVAPNGLNIRKKPALSAGKIVLIPYLDKIEVIDKTDTFSDVDGVLDYWLKVRYGNKSGYIFGGYVSFVEPVCRNEHCRDFLIAHYSSAKDGKCNGSILKLHDSFLKVSKLLGNPMSVSDYGGAELYVYKDVSIGLNNELPKNPGTIVYFYYDVMNDKISLQDLISVLGIPEINYDTHDCLWVLDYRFPNSVIQFMVKDLNNYVEFILVSDNKGGLKNNVFKPALEGKH